MIDGKVSSILSEVSNSYQTCPICGCPPREMNTLDTVLHREVNAEAIDLWLSILHAWIRFFLTLSPFELQTRAGTWQARGKESKEKVATKKKEVQEKMKDNFGIFVDFPKTGGSGTTNDGNTARIAFRKHEEFASILGLNPELIKRFFIILCTISCKEAVDPDKLKTNCIYTWKQVNYM